MQSSTSSDSNRFFIFETPIHWLANIKALKLIELSDATFILLLNPTLLAFYTFGCHAFRHLIGGKEDCFTCPIGNEKVQHKLWRKVSYLNSKHMLWAWVSMIWVAITDLYIMLVSKGVLTDWNTWS